MESPIDEIVSAEDLAKYEERYNVQLRRGQPSTQAQFEYAWCLVRCRGKQEMRTGIAMFEDLLAKDDEGLNRRDYLYYLAIGYARLREYERASKFAKALLGVEPDNVQAADLAKTIEERMKRDGMVGAAILGGAAAAGGAVLVGLIAALAARSRS